MSDQEVSLFEGDDFKAPTVASTQYTPEVSIGGASWNKIGLKGSRFNYIPVNGDAIEGPKFGSLDVVILGVPKPDERGRTAFHRGFYLKSFSDDEAGGPPDCFSEDGEAPHASVPADTKQSDRCSNCPMGIKGSADDGKGRACSFNLPIVAAPIGKDGAFDVNRAALWRLNAGSLIGESDEAGLAYSFKEFTARTNAEIKKLRAKNPSTPVSLASLIVHCRFDDRGSENFKILFKPKKFVTDAMVTHMNEAPRVDVEAMLSYGDAAAAAPAADASTGASAPAPAPPAPASTTPAPAPAAAPAPAPAPAPAAAAPAPAAATPDAPAELSPAEKRKATIAAKKAAEAAAKAAAPAAPDPLDAALASAEAAVDAATEAPTAPAPEANPDPAAPPAAEPSFMDAIDAEVSEDSFSL